MISQASIDRFLAQRSMAIAGVSRSGKKFGNMAFKTLQQKGYTLYPLHRDVQEIAGTKCYQALADLPAEVEDLLLVIPATQSESLLKTVPASGIKRVWMQQGAESDQAIRYCAENDIPLIHGTCILMHAQPTGIHRFHHWLMGLFGKHPR